MKIGTLFAVAFLIILALAALVIIADSAISETGPAMRSARADAARADAAKAWAEANAASAWSAAQAAQAPARARLLQTTLSALAAVLVLAAAGAAYALILHLILRARLVNPDRHTGLYPAVPALAGEYQLLNDPGTQALAAATVAANGRLRAPTAGRILQTLLNPPPAPSTPSIPGAVLPDCHPALPTLVEIYDAPPVPHPALSIGIGPNGPISLPLHQLGNILIGGLPRHGKSELIAAIIAGILRGAGNGAAVQFALIDPKLVDFGLVPDDLAALWQPVARNLPDAKNLIDLTWSETDRRFQLLQQAGAKNLRQYNQHAPTRLPYLVVVIDEIAQIAPDRRAAGPFLETVQRIGAKAPAAGVSLIMATHRPSADIIPSALRGICGVQIAFRTLNADDSRTILGVSGAELLPAGIPGRCLVRQGEITPCQAYHAGLDTGRFDQYLAARPRRSQHRPVDQPVVDTVATVPTATTGQNGHLQPQPLQLERGRAPDPAAIAWIRAAAAAGVSLTSICIQLWGYKDGIVWAYVKDALNTQDSHP